MSLLDPLETFNNSKMAPLESAVGCDPRQTKTPSSAELSWRTDPKISCSDWKIVVNKVTPNDNFSQANEDDPPASKRARGNSRGEEVTGEAQVTYNVHICILAFSSEYFRALLDQVMETEESKTRTSVLTLHADAADAFPIYLDFAYEQTTAKKNQRASCISSELDASNVIGLRHLAQYFGVKGLLQATAAFILDDIKESDPDKNRNYALQADMYRDEQVKLSVYMEFSRREAMETSLRTVAGPIVDHTLEFLSNCSGKAFSKYFESHGASAFIKTWKEIKRAYYSDEDRKYVRENPPAHKVKVYDAGISLANGDYIIEGRYGQYPLFSNGIFDIVFSTTWCLCLGVTLDYASQHNPNDRNWRVLYKSNKTDPIVPPYCSYNSWKPSIPQAKPTPIVRCWPLIT